MILLFLFLSMDPCVNVTAGRITAGDFAARTGALAGVDPALDIGYAPDTGLVRRYSAAEVARLALRLGGDAALASPICFVSAATPIDRAEVERAMLDSLRPMSTAITLAIVEFPRIIAPAGRATFPLHGLTPPTPAERAGETRTWRGRWVTHSGRSQPLAVRVRITETATVAVARRELARGDRLTADAVSWESREIDPVDRAKPIRQSSLPVAAAVTRTIPSGSIVTEHAVAASDVVLRGSMVEAVSRSGSALIRVQARAETSGRVGSRIWLRSPFGSGRVAALVVGPDRVEIEGHQ